MNSHMDNPTTSIKRMNIQKNNETDSMLNPFLFKVQKTKPINTQMKT